MAARHQHAVSRRREANHALGFFREAFRYSGGGGGGGGGSGGGSGGGGGGARRGDRAGLLQRHLGDLALAPPLAQRGVQRAV